MNAWDALVNDIAKTFDWPRNRVEFALSSHRPAIEAEARASQPLTLDVDRLRTAWLNATTDGEHNANCLKTTCPVAGEVSDFVPLVIAEYERLSR